MPPVSDTGRIFMEKTKYRYLTPSDQEKHLPQPPLEVPPDPEKPVFGLPKPETIDVPSLDLRTAIEERHSVRVYEKEPLTIPELGFLLWCTQGVKKVAGTSATFRTVPSAGARHALETYLLINDIEGLEPGLYRYLALTHRLQQTRQRPDAAYPYRQSLSRTAICHAVRGGLPLGRRTLPYDLAV